MMMAAAWLPWVALGILLTIRERAIWAAPAGLALGLAVPAFYQILTVGALTIGGVVWAAARDRGVRGRARAAARVIGLAAVIGLIGGLVHEPG
jgi:hypothetical protein